MKSVDKYCVFSFIDWSRFSIIKKIRDFMDIEL